MKIHKHHTYEKALEQIEQMIEETDPDKIVNVSDFTERVKIADRSNEITKATVMLLKKYGINFEKGDA